MSRAALPSFAELCFGKIEYPSLAMPAHRANRGSHARRR